MAGMTNKNRVASGVPAGGEFSAHDRQEAEVRLRALEDKFTEHGGHDVAAAVDELRAKLYPPENEWSDILPGTSVWFGSDAFEDDAIEWVSIRRTEIYGDDPGGVLFVEAGLGLDMAGLYADGEDTSTFDDNFDQADTWIRDNYDGARLVDDGSSKEQLTFAILTNIVEGDIPGGQLPGTLPGVITTVRENTKLVQLDADLHKTGPDSFFVRLREHLDGLAEAEADATAVEDAKTRAFENRIIRDGR